MPSERGEAKLHRAVRLVRGNWSMIDPAYWYTPPSMCSFGRLCMRSSLGVHAHYFWLGTCKWPLSTCCCFNATLVLYAYIGMFVRMIVRAQQRIAAYSRACDVKMLFLTLPSRFAWTSTTYQCKHTCIQTRILTHALSHPPHLVPFCLEYSATYSASHSASYSDYSASYSDTDWHYISFLC
jgi:hypothetical protein